MQDDLIERASNVRSELWAALIADDRLHKALLARIAALEAKLAEKDALLRECGEALERLTTKLTEIFGHSEYKDVFLTAQLRRGPYNGPNCAEELATAIATLAKIKDATDA